MYAEFMKRADLILAIGSSLTKTSFGPPVPGGKTLIHSTNDAGDINKDYRADLGIVGDAALVIDALIEEVGRQRSSRSNTALDSLKTDIAGIKKGWLAEWKKHFESDEMPINQYRVIGEMLKTLDRDNTIITHDAGSPREQLLPFWETTRAGSYLGWGKSTQLGYGLGLAMGAKLAAPDKFCVNVMGDCSFGMTGMDIETASRNRIAILTVVFNNGVMACERDVMKVSTNKYNALTVGGNYSKVAEGLNVASERVEKPADIAPVLKDAVGILQSGAPFLLEVVAKEGYDFSRYN
jgi:acetolactate synthase-1/2/3 large subunit